MIASRFDLTDWIIEALEENHGKGSLVQVCKIIWRRHEPDLRSAGDLFYTWQYDVRWAATELRNSKKMKPAHESAKGLWELSNK